MIRHAIHLAPVLLAAVLAPLPAAAAVDSPDTELVRRGDAVITRADWDAEVLRIPPKDRVDFVSSPRRNRALLERMLATRELAIQARQKKLDADPMVRARIRQEEDKILAATLVTSVEDAAARDFDLKLPMWERRAREVYETDRAKFATPETVMVTWLFFSAGKDGFDSAQARAADALAKIRAGADIGDLAAAVSEDATTREVRGRKGPLAHADVDPTVANAVFALKQKGAVTDAIRTREGYFVVRLDERRPAVPRSFDEVRAEMLADMKVRHVDATKTAMLETLGAGKEIVADQAAIEALRTSAAGKAAAN